MICPYCKKEFEIDRGEIQKKGMIQKSLLGKVMSRAPFGYKIINNELVIDQEDSKKIEEIFNEFLNNEISLNKLSEKYGFSVNGIKKILTNFTYIGKVKFDNQIHDGRHQPIISAILFNKIQDKLEKLKIK